MQIPAEYVKMIISYGEQLLFALLILIAGTIVIRTLIKIIRKKTELKGVDPTLRSFLISFISVSLNILLFLSIAGTLGIQMTSFITILGAAGLAVGLALQGSLSNFAGGVLILIFRPFSIGDFIEAQGFSGSVAEIRLLYTVLNTPDNKRVMIPNGNLSNNSITNFSANPARRVDLVYGISYNDDIDAARDVINRIIAENEMIEKDPEPFTGVIEHAESSINFAVRVWCRKENYLKVLVGMNESVKKEFDKAGITIPFPQQDVHIYNT